MSQPLSQLTPEQQKELQEKIKKMSPEELMEFQKQQCIFCQIVSGKIASKRIYDDENCLAILDINPASRGHLLLLPKEHYAIMPQIPEQLIEHMFVVARKLSQLLLKALRVEGTYLFVANGLVAGQKSQHFMIHLIPSKEESNIIPIEEHLLDPEQKEKVKTLVESHIHQLLGLKENAQEIISIPAQEKKPLLNKGVSGKKNIDSEDIKGKEYTENKEISVVDKSETSPKKKTKKKVKSSKTFELNNNPKEVEEDNEPKTIDEDKQDEKGDVSLDDIANLFK